MRSAEEILDRRPCLTGGVKRLSICYSGREADTKRFLPVRKSPFTNTAKSLLFCSPKVNISLLFTKGLQYREILGKIYIEYGFIRTIVTGNISLF